MLLTLALVRSMSARRRSAAITRGLAHSFASFAGIRSSSRWWRRWWAPGVPRWVTEWAYASMALSLAARCLRWGCPSARVLGADVNSAESSLSDRGPGDAAPSTQSDDEWFGEILTALDAGEHPRDVALRIWRETPSLLTFVQDMIVWHM